MDQETLYNILSGAYGPVFGSIEMWECINALGLKPHKEDGKWYFAIHDCYGRREIAGYGETIYEAASNFYKAICEQKA
jgi:hypothetical protein